uniref:Paralytic protein 1 n=2 Tax=Braconinae TaxID=65225 RepID=A0A455LAP2_9HYME|nr:paralytic protein 1 [Habrobracon hebetor]
MKFVICLSLALLATSVFAERTPDGTETFEAVRKVMAGEELLSRDKRGLFDFIVHAKDILGGIGNLAKGIEDAINKVKVVVDKVQGQAAAQAAAAGIQLPSKPASR